MENIFLHEEITINSSLIFKVFMLDDMAIKV